MQTMLSLSEVTKDYGSKKNPIRALGPVTLEIEAGSFNIIIGKSGSGKSTLLNLMSGLDTPTTGFIKSFDGDITKAKSNKLARYRSNNGVIFQFYNLLANLNTLENILMGNMASGQKPNKEKAHELLERFNLTHRTNANVQTLSGGEKQRVAICRALVNDPKILFCDEPTGALDTANEEAVKNILVELNKEGLTIVMVTHNEEFLSLGSKVIKVKDGLAEIN
jgi:putative ABC transport system ATP-binding protein